MEKQEFLGLDAKAQLELLNGKLEGGASIDDLCAEFDMTKTEFGKHGLYFVNGKFLVKPHRGFQTTKASGWEKPRD
ncbi:MAG: hypothetical protein AB2L09_11090 [Coriobacteriia bacterium]